ncbi:uncharacterized protein LOC134820772 [Bolinopsis microptera]|uniref:uncharacterized protein LOC134820772 n=1 Tax=Bolinopsis microptera TaxID=2820187 RepID=UPI00307AF6C9
MDFLNALSIELCDTVLCCNNWYADGKPPHSPTPEEEGTSISQESQPAKNEFLVGALPGEIGYKSSSHTLSKHSSVDHGEDASEKHQSGWETCDIRKRPEYTRTLKEMAEEFEAQRDAEEALRLQLLRVNKKEEGEEDKLLTKDQSFVTTDGDDDSMDLRASSFCSVSSNNMLPIDQSTKKDSSREMSCDDMEDPVRPSSKLETDSKDSGYGAENNRSKRKFVKFPEHHRSLDGDHGFNLSTSPQPFECDPDVCYDGLPQRPNTSCDVSEGKKKNGGFFSSFRSKKNHTEKDHSEEEQSSTTKKKRKKKSSSSSSKGGNNLQVTSKQQFVLRGKKNPNSTNGGRVPGHSFDNGDM